MSRQDLARFHVEALRDYLELWCSSEERQQQGVSAREAAYCLIEHAGMVRRYTGAPLSGLEGLSALQRIELVRQACGYLQNLTLAEQGQEAIANEALTEDQFEQLENILLLHDASFCALTTLRHVAKTVRTEAASEVSDPDGAAGGLTWRLLTACLARAAAKLAEVDALFLQRPDVASGVCRVMAGVREQIRTPIDSQRQWWFREDVDWEMQWESPAQRTGEQVQNAAACTIEPVWHAGGRRRGGVVASSPTEPTLALQAAKGMGLRWMRFVVEGLPDLYFECSWLSNDRLQFVVFDRRTDERSLAADGVAVVLRQQNNPIARAVFQDGQALTPANPFTHVEIVAANGGSLGWIHQENG